MNKLNTYLSSLLLAVFLITNQINPQTISIFDKLNKNFTSADLISDLDFILEKISQKEYNRSPYNFISEVDFNKTSGECKGIFFKK